MGGSGAHAPYDALCICTYMRSSTIIDGCNSRFDITLSILSDAPRSVSVLLSHFVCYHPVAVYAPSYLCCFPSCLLRTLVFLHL
eukprot:jgi/Botrbrau1/8708/Bobra.0311s0020.1